MRHLKYIIVFIFFAVIPVLLIKSGTNLYLNFLEEKSFEEAFTEQNKHLKKLRSDIMLKTVKHDISNRIINDISRLDGLDSSEVRTIKNRYYELYPDMLKIIVLNDKFKAVARDEIKYRFIFEQFGKYLFKTQKSLDTGLSKSKIKLFKKIIGEWQTPQKIAFRSFDVTEIVYDGKRMDLFWGSSKNLKNSKKNDIKATVMILINQKIYNKLFSIENLLKKLKKKLIRENIEVSLINTKEKSVSDFFKIEDKSIKASQLLRYAKNYIGRTHLYTLIPVGEISNKVVYAKKSKDECFKEKKIYTKLTDNLLIAFLIIFLVISFLVYYKYLNIFISARTQLISLFLLAYLLPLTAIFYLGFNYIESTRESILENKYEEVRKKIQEIDNAAISYKNNLVHISQSIKDMPETRNFNIKFLEPLLKKYRMDNVIRDYFVFNKSAEIVLTHTNRQKENPFSLKLARGLAKAIINFYNQGTYKMKKDVGEKDSIGEALTSLLFNPSSGALQVMFKNWGNIHTMDFLGRKYNTYVDVIVDDNDNAVGVILFYFDMDRLLNNILVKFISDNYTNKEENIRVFNVTADQLSRKYQKPVPFSPELLNLAHKISIEKLPQQDIFIYKNRKMIVLGRRLREIKNQIAIGMIPFQEVTDTYERNKNIFIRLLILTLIIAISIALIIVKKFLSPIKILRTGVDALTAGDLNYRMNIKSRDEFGILSDAFNHMTSNLKETMFKLELSNRDLELTNITLDKRLSELQVLYDISQKLHFITEIDDLIELILDKINDTLNAHHSSILLLNEEKTALKLKLIRGIDIPDNVYIELKPDEGIAGLVLKENKVIMVNDVDKDERFKNLNKEIPEDRKTKSLICAPLVISKKTVGVINIVNKMTEDMHFSSEDINLIESIATQLSMTIENFYLNKELLEKERMAKELEIAKTIQSGLFPAETPVYDNYELDFHNTPAMECGGDYYDYIKLDETHTGIAIADVSGKGVPAALLMVMVRTVLRVEAKNSLSPPVVINHLNYHLSNIITQGRFVTFLYGILDEENHEFVFTSAGHNYPFLYKAETGKAEELELDGLILGVMTDVNYEVMKIKMDPGDVLVLFTDGVTEAQNSEKELFDESRLQKSICMHADLSASEIRKAIEKDVFDFVGEMPQYDDTTLVVLKRTVNGTESSESRSEA